MPGKPAPGRRKVTIWMDGALVDRYRVLAPPHSLAGVLARAVAAEVARLTTEKGMDLPGQGK